MIRQPHAVLRSLVTLTLLPAAALALAGCSGRERAATGAVGAATPVRTFVAGASAAGDEMVLPGRARAREEVTLTARITARLTTLPRREGERFAAGQTLARFDAPETGKARAAAEAGLAAATLRRAVALRQYARIESLYAARVVSARDRELADAERQSAEAAWSSASADEADWATGTSIPAPFAGVVVRRHVDVGATVGAGQPLLDLRSDATGEIEVPVPESGVDAIRGAAITYDAGDGVWRRARLERLDGMTDYATRTRTAHLDPLGAGTLEPGAYVRVRFAAAPGPGDTARAGTASIHVPAACIVRRGALAGVYVIRGDRAELRWLRLGRVGEADVEVLAGLWPGERIARTPEGLADGVAVRVEP